MRLLIFTLWSLALWAQTRAITLTKEVPGGIVNLGTVATPTVDNDTGTYNANTVVTFSDATTGALIWTCTGAGADCTPNALNNPITVTATGTHVCAVAKKVDYTDSVRKCATITLQAATPTFNPVAGAVDNPTTVTISSTTSGAVICHTEGDGSQAAPTATTPGTCATGTTGATVNVTAATTIKAIGTKASMANSATGSAAYTINVVGLLSEDFDTCASNGAGCAVTWTNTTDAPTADFAYATAPAPLDGTKSLRVASSGPIAGKVSTYTAQNTVYFYAIVNYATLVGGANSFALLDSSDTVVLDVSNANPEFRLHCGSVTAFSTAITQGTTYHIWGDYTKGTGADAVCHLYHATSATKPGSPNITITTGTATTQASKVGLRAYSTGVHIYDKVRISTTNIGSNPQ